ncbi:cholesterol catabolism transcriptional regulator KstR [Mycolicibacterium thermoresistibile]
MSSSTGTNPEHGSGQPEPERNGTAASGADTGSPGANRTRPRQVTNVAVLTESELGSEAQRERRKRILDATLAIASKGGYEAVQMRAVAERADVAVGTLYRYFPSKVHLLVSALGREFERIDAKTDRAALVGDTPYERLNFMVGRLNRAMQRNPLLTEAMTRAFVFADASAAGEVDHVGRLMDSMFARAMSDGEPTEDQYHIARVISDVWLSNLLAWLTRRASATDVSKRLELAVRLLIGDGEHPKI